MTQLGILKQSCFLVDTKPVLISGYKRSKRRSYFLGSANYGFCASRNLKYFGYKLVMVSTLKGLPVVYDLVPANLDERLAAEAIIDQFSCCDFFADKGFIGLAWQSQIFEQTCNLVWTTNISRIRNTWIVGCVLFASVSKVFSMNCRTPDAISNGY